MPENDGEDFRKRMREAYAEMCEKYVDSGKPQKTDLDKDKYKRCCEEAYYCSVWAQAWFWYTIGGVILLLILISVAGCVYCCCIRKRGGAGGGDTEMQTSEEIEHQKEETSECDSSESSCDSDCG